MTLQKYVCGKFIADRVFEIGRGRVGRARRNVKKEASFGKGVESAEGTLWIATLLLMV